MLRAYLARLALAADILANVVLFGQVETLSSRMGRSIQSGARCAVCGAVCWLLSRWWPDHCVNNIMNPVNQKD